MERILISPQKYIQGRNVIEKIGEYVKPLGTKLLVIADECVWHLVGEKVMESFHKQNLSFEKVGFNGESSENEIARIEKIGKEFGADVIIGIGGGKSVDTAKAVGEILSAKVVSVPTIASTDAPTSSLSVIYSDDGVFEKYKFYLKNPDIILVDSQVIAQAPSRFLAAGIGDGMATWIEARANLESRKPAMAGGLSTLAAAKIAELCWDTLFQYGEAALLAVKQKTVTPAVEAVIEANTLLSGLGFESVGLAAAHAIHNGFTVLHDKTHDLMHGEKVAFGTLVQMALESWTTEELYNYIDFCIKLGLPTTLKDLNLGDASKEELMKVAEAACQDGETIHNMPFEISPEMVFDAIIAADAYATEYKLKKLVQNYNPKN
ncbi:glycerol dehydrogenase [Bacillus thuringiensis]|uniref:Glycerol dehydrogenase n=1 Tax=Bacillus thuringiensis TaxID=1428 RepID=A0AAW9JRB7_BACTU|nr:glycerol dehydrogenase [Bacillus thuringiensis]MDZ5479841.1 glycerol dehydrogenase [Bacillus thuringiensis]